MSVEVVGAVDVLGAEWEELATAVGARPWYRPGWFSAWYRAFGSGRTCIVAVRRRGALRALVPLVRRAGAVRSASNWHSPDVGLLAADPDAARELADALFDLHGAWLRIAPFDPNAGLDLCREQAARHRHRVAVSTQMESPYVSLEAGARTPGSLPSPKRRKALAKARRELAAHGTVEFDVRDGTEGLDALLREGFSVEGSGWKSRRDTAINSDPDTESFYVDVAHWAAPDGLLRLCFLRVGGRAVAFEFVLDDGRSLYDLKGGYDPVHRRQMPGFLIAQDLIAHAAALRRQTFEFLGDAESFKMEWTDRVRRRVSFTAFAPNVGGAAAHVAHRYVRPLVKRGLETIRVRTEGLGTNQG